jgi:hypothetical protein
LKKQSKRGRPLLSTRMIHTAVVLPPDLIENLKKDGQTSGHGLSTEIRERLRHTYLVQNRDPKTANLLDAIRLLAENIERHVRKKWHEHPYALAAFTAGVQDLLARHAVPGDNPNKRPDATLAGANDPPDVVGRTLARLVDF